MRFPEQEQDDIDRLFARLPMVEPPADLAQRVLLSLPESPVMAAPAKSMHIKHQASHVHRWIAIAAAVVFFIMSIQLGTALDSSGAFSLVGEALSNASTSNDYVSALLAAMPWVELLITLAAFAVFFIMTNRAISDTQPQRSSMA